MTPDDFAREFARAFAGQDAAALTALLHEDGEMLTVTGQWVEGQKAAAAAIQSEFEGIFASARLVTGKGNARSLGTGRALLRQRFVISGARDAVGRDMARFAAMLIAVLEAKDGRWSALHLSFVALP